MSLRTQIGQSYPSQASVWLFFFFSKRVLWECDHGRSAAGFCEPCGRTLSGVEVLRPWSVVSK